MRIHARGASAFGFSGLGHFWGIYGKDDLPAMVPEDGTL